MFLFDEQYLVCRGESISSLSNISINKKPVFVSYVVTFKKIAQAGSAPASRAEGRWFDSSHPDHSLHESNLPGVTLSFVLRSMS